MTREDINDIINAICPNDEDYEKPCISPKYLRQELEQLALDQRQWNGESTTKNNLGVDCIDRQKYFAYLDGVADGLIESKNDVSEVIDKIRAEIDKIYEREGNSVDCLNALDELKWVIDKYKGGSEG